MDAFIYWGSARGYRSLFPPFWKEVLPTYKLFKSLGENRRHISFLRIAAGLPLLASCQPPAEPPAPSESLSIGTRLELLLDDYLIESRVNKDADLFSVRFREAQAGGN